MKTTAFKGVAFLLFLMVMNISNAQIKSENILVAWENMTKMVVETAEAMPEKFYEFKPTENLRSFREQIGHTAGANYLFASVVNLDRPDPSPITDTKNKREVIEQLKASFAFIKAGIEKLEVEDLNEEIEFFGNKMSRLQSILIMTSHLQREHGKTTIYTRLKEVAPGPSGGW